MGKQEKLPEENEGISESVRVCIYVPKILHQAVKVKAEVEGISQSEVWRRMGSKAVGLDYITRVVSRKGGRPRGDSRISVRG